MDNTQFQAAKLRDSLERISGAGQAILKALEEKDDSSIYREVPSLFMALLDAQNAAGAIEFSCSRN